MRRDLIAPVASWDELEPIPSWWLSTPSQIQESFGFILDEFTSYYVFQLSTGKICIAIAST